MDRMALSIDEFCRAYGVGRNQFYTLQKAGLAPPAMRIGGRVVIPTSSLPAWQKRMTERAALQGQEDCVA